MLLNTGTMPGDGMNGRVGVPLHRVAPRLRSSRFRSGSEPVRSEPRRSACSQAASATGF